MLLHSRRNQKKVRKKKQRVRIRLGQKKQSCERRKISANSGHKGNSKMHATRTVDIKKRSRGRHFFCAYFVGKATRRCKNSRIDVVDDQNEILPKSTYLRKERTTEGFLKLCWFLNPFHLQENTNKLTYMKLKQTISMLIAELCMLHFCLRIPDFNAKTFCKSIIFLW